MAVRVTFRDVRSTVLLRICRARSRRRELRISSGTTAPTSTARTLRLRMAEDEEGPKDPITPSMENAAVLHEVYLSLQSAGFSQSEALIIIVGMLNAALG